MVLIDGSVVSENILNKLQLTVAELKTPRKPGLAVVLVGQNPASQSYVGSKQKACERIGFVSFEHLLPETVTQEALASLIDQLNADEKVDGILLQLPLPKGLNEQELLERISPSKDVDGFHPNNIGKLLLGLPGFWPCTPFGVYELLKAYTISTQGKHVVIVGRSNIVGKPMASILVQKDPHANATVTICHSHTPNMEHLTQQADILIAAIGQPHFIKASMVKTGATVIDVGINRVEDSSSPKGYKIVGDVDFESVAKVASALTPVPKGVGPMTIAMLMTNTLKAFYNHTKGS